MGWPDLTYRSRLEPELRNELDQLVALTQGFLAAEHGADGQHTTITVNGLQFRGADGTILATISLIDGVLTVTFPPPATASDGPGMQIGDVLVGHHRQVHTFSVRSGIDLNTDAPPDLGGRWLLAAARDSMGDALLFANYAADTAANLGIGIALYYNLPPFAWNGYALCPPASGSPTLEYILGSDLDSRLLWDQVNARLIYADVSFRERNRALPLGEWADVPFNAANFTGGGGMGVTVDPADQIAFAYTLVGLTMTVTVYLAPISVSGGNPRINVAIPNGHVAARHVYTALGRAYDNGALVPGVVIAEPGSAVLAFERLDNAPWAASVDSTYLLGSITFPIL